MKEIYYDASVGILRMVHLMQKVLSKFRFDMKPKMALCLLLLLFCLHVEAQQRKRVVNQRRPTTPAVRKSVQTAITKTRKVGADDFVWYELKKGKLCGAADSEGKIIIPIKYKWVQYKEIGPNFSVCSSEGKGIYTRSGRCVIPESLGLDYAGVYKKSENGFIFKFILGDISSEGLKALFDMNGNEVIPLDYYDFLFFSLSDEVPHIYCERSGQKGAFDLNGNVLVRPIYKGSIYVSKDKIKIIHEKDGEEKIDYIYGSYSANTRFNFKSIGYRPMNNSSSSITSAYSNRSSSSSSSSSNSTQRREVWKERWRVCTNCDPDRKGYCRNCHGRGGYYIGNYYNVCGVCAGTRVCTLCGGRGECKEAYKTWE